MRYTRTHDSGHSWLAVPINELKELGIADQISSYSYQDKDIAYLEEDCDMPLFLNKAGIITVSEYQRVVRDVYLNRESDIRHKKSYSIGQK